jgi:hypothetical protein
MSLSIPSHRYRLINANVSPIGAVLKVGKGRKAQEVVVGHEGGAE